MAAASMSHQLHARLTPSRVAGGRPARRPAFRVKVTAYWKKYTSRHFWEGKPSRMRPRQGNTRSFRGTGCPPDRSHSLLARFPVMRSRTWRPRARLGARVR